MRELPWTTEKPTKLGHYWWRFYDDGPTVIELDDCGEWWKGGVVGPWIPPDGSEFSGPLEPPR